MKSLLGLMPVRSGSSSFADVQNVLTRLGLASRVQTGISIHEVEFPAVAHLTGPDHFVVVLSKSDTDLHLFDDRSRLMVPIDVFEERFSGNILTVIPQNESLRVLRSAVANPQFDTLRVDVGRIEMGSEPLNVEFPFRNLGQERLHIGTVSVSCGCLKGEPLSAIVEPGESSCINVQFLPNVGNGSFEHEVFVQTNAPDGFRLLKVSGVLARRTIMPEIVYAGDLVIGESNETTIRASGDFNIENIVFSTPEVEVSWRTASASEVKAYAVRARRVSCPTCGTASFGIITLTPRRGILPRAFDEAITYNSIGSTKKLKSRVIGRIVRPFELRPEQIFVKSQIDKPQLTVVPKVSGSYRIVGVESTNSILHFDFDAGLQSGTSTVTIAATGPWEELHGTTANVQIRTDSQAEDVVVPITFFVARSISDAE